MSERVAIFLFTLVGAGLLGWRLGSTLSSDAVGMVVGFLFGILAGIPPMLLVIASNRNQNHYQQPNPYANYRQAPPPRQQPRIEVHNHHHYHGQQSRADMQTLDQLLEEIENEEWVRQLSTGTAPKRIATKHSNNSQGF